MDELENLSGVFIHLFCSERVPGARGFINTRNVFLVVLEAEMSLIKLLALSEVRSQTLFPNWYFVQCSHMM